MVKYTKSYIFDIKQVHFEQASEIFVQFHFNGISLFSERFKRGVKKIDAIFLFQSETLALR